MIEAVIGACYLEFGYEATAEAVVEAFSPEIEQALERPADFKSALQERLARRGAVVIYEVTAEEGPPHERRFEVAAMVGRRGARARRGPLEEGRRAGGRRGGARRPGDVRRLMHLRSITLKGFKSFPDRTRLDFSPGVSVIVGPNGSGKSNITDAVLWAMGEQSPLAVRGQSMQDVIFAGAHGVQARSEAEVEVVLDNGDGAVDLPAGEISIVRRLNRAGEGEYRVNGARCRLTDVLELLSDTGLGKEMHSVVSQGRVEAIVTSKPRDRRMLIEEAAGLGKHRKRRRRAQLKLGRTQDNLDRALDVEREARTRLRPLKRQAEAAELHERLERQTDEARWSLAREDVRAARAALAEAEAAVAAARAAAARDRGSELRRGRRAARAAPRRRWPRAAPSARALSNRFYAARSARERIGLREEAARQAAADAARPRRPPPGAAGRAGGRGGRRHRRRRRRRADRRRSRPSSPSSPRTAASGSSASSPSSRRAAARPRQELAGLAEAAEAAGARAARGRRRRRGRARAPAARPRPAAERARREAARTGAELAKLNQFLRAHAGAPGRRRRARRRPQRRSRLRARARGRARPAAARGGRRRPRRGRARCSTARAATAAPRWSCPTPRPAGRGRRRPAPGAEPLSAHVRADGDGRLAAALLADVWVVDALDGARPGVRRHRGHARRPRVVAGHARAAAGPGGRRGPRARRAQPPRRAGRRGRARRAGRAGRAGGRRGGLARRARPPTPRATRPSAPRAPRRGRATRPPRPSGTPAG